MQSYEKVSCHTDLPLAQLSRSKASTEPSSLHPSGSREKKAIEEHAYFIPYQSEHLTPVAAGELKSQIPQDNENKATKPRLFQSI